MESSIRTGSTFEGITEKRYDIMKQYVLLLLSANLLFSGCTFLPIDGAVLGGTVSQTRAYLQHFDHVLLVCVTEDRVAPGDHPARSNLHFSGTVVRVYKGDWKVSDTLSWVHDLDSRIPVATNQHTGKLFFVFTNTHSEKEFFLDTGEWPRWSEDLATQIEMALR